MMMMMMMMMRRRRRRRRRTRYFGRGPRGRGWVRNFFHYFVLLCDSSRRARDGVTRDKSSKFGREE